MNNPKSAEPEHLCKELSNALKGILTWKWDDRFGTVLSEFSTDNKTHIHDVLKGRLDRVWDISGIEKAPDVVKTVISGLGGMIPGQLLFTSDPAGPLVFCAWWPWGNGKTISIRIAVLSIDSDRSEESRRLKEWFGINSNA
ncbi:MAG: hypothetical protein AB1427_08515 [Thermodesulfobacteriota bacterium]